MAQQTAGEDSGSSSGAKGRYGLEKGLALLVIVTLVAILAERPILETSIRLDSSDGWVSHYSDAGGGGQSNSQITDPEAMSWRCNLVVDVHAYCGFELIFDPERTNGLDLRNYDRIKLWLDYEGPTETLRVYLRNFDPEYSSPLLNDSTKYNQVEFGVDLLQQGGPVEFAMADFFVANWWFHRYRLPPELAHPQFDNIVVFEVQTGVSPVSGEHEFRLEQIELSGQVLSTEQWYQAIVGAWLMVALGFLGVRSWLLTRALRRKSLREKELLEINSLLDSRSQALEEKAKTDPLTGAFNREGIKSAITAGLSERRSQGKPLSLIMLDLDHFKQVNDRYGHMVGDQVLTGLSELVKNNIRSDDLFARWGGEEFVLVCRDTSLQDATSLAEKLRALISQEDFAELEGISASFGVASLGAQETLDQLFGRADAALYEAKSKGRNRVEVS